MDETEQWKEISSTSTGAAEPETPGQHSQIDEIRINLTILDEVEGLEDRVNGASLQGKVGDNRADIDGLVQDCIISNAWALEILQSALSHGYVVQNDQGWYWWLSARLQYLQC